MLSLLLVAAASLAVSTLTLFSGFGLGTLLLPVFVLFFPVHVAVAATAVVHMANNLFKVGLLYRHVRSQVIVQFGVPAIVLAFVGAMLLAVLATQPPLHTWQLGSYEASITPLKAVMGAIILGFALFELVPRLQSLRVSPRWLPLGGAISGFFGGLSGHQGAFRAAFLAPLGLSPVEFASTQAVLATLVDLARLMVYGVSFFAAGTEILASDMQWSLVLIATLSAFAGALFGKKLLPKVTVQAVRYLTGILLLIVGMALALGLA